MYNLHKTPDILALEEQWRKQAEREERSRSQTGGRATGKSPAGGPKLESYEDLKIPALPAATVLLIDMCRDPEASYAKLSQIIQADSGLSVKLLRLANSAYYAQSKKVATIVRALTVLGMKEVRTIGLSYKLMSVVQEYARSSFDFQAHWERSLLLGVVAKEIARGLPGQCADEAFLAGLLQDIGVVILHCNHEQEYLKVQALRVEEPDMSLIQAEQRILGTHHAKVGAEVCAHWKFPPALVQAVRDHHRACDAVPRGEPAGEIQAAAYAASLMPDFINGHQPMQILQDLESLGVVPAGGLGDVLMRAHESFEALQNLFESHQPGDMRIAQLMLDAIAGIRNISSAQDAVLMPPE